MNGAQKRGDTVTSRLSMDTDGDSHASLELLFQLYVLLQSQLDSTVVT